MSVVCAIVIQMEASFFDRHPGVRDALGFLIFAFLVLVGTVTINAFIFRSFNVVGPSMESTMYTGDRLIVDRLPVTWSHIRNKPYVPARGDIIVFKNPRYIPGGRDEFIVKRVIAFPGEKVVVEDGKVRVYNDANPNGFNPDKLASGGTPGSPTRGDETTTVTEGTLYVMGDHRQGEYSCDSRDNCLGLIPYYDVVGPVSLRIWPLNKFHFF